MTQGRPAGMSLSDFMNHSTRGSGGGRSIAKNWSKKAPNAVTIWLSMQASIYTLWRHSFYRVEPRENKETHEKTIEVWQDKLVCFEDEREVLTRMYFRNKETGERDYPPRLCPVCLMIEDVFHRCQKGADVADALLAKDPKAPFEKIVAACHDAGALYWLEPLFRFEGLIMKEGGVKEPGSTVVHAGGLYNAYGSKHLTDTDKARMAAVPRAAGGPVYAKYAWKENMLPKMEYVYSAVNHDDPAAGVQLYVESKLLGEKMQTELGKTMLRKGKEKGNPILHPYPFRWTHDPADGIAFDKKYDATALDEVRLTPAIEKLIRDTEPPDVKPLLAKFNLATHRARLEQYALVDLPFDDYFRAALKAEKERPAEAAEAAEAAETERAPGPAQEVGRQGPTAQGLAQPMAREPLDAPPVGDEKFSCDAKGFAADGRTPICPGVMAVTDAECPVCGAKYDVIVEPEPPPPPPPLPSRRSATRAAPATASSPAQATNPKGSLGALAPPAGAFADPAPGDAGFDDDLIPF